MASASLTSLRCAATVPASIDVLAASQLTIGPKPNSSAPGGCACFVAGPVCVWRDRDVANVKAQREGCSVAKAKSRSGGAAGSRRGLCVVAAVDELGLRGRARRPGAPSGVSVDDALSSRDRRSAGTGGRAEPMRRAGSIEVVGDLVLADTGREYASESGARRPRSAAVSDSVCDREGDKPFAEFDRGDRDVAYVSVGRKRGLLPVDGQGRWSTRGESSVAENPAVDVTLAGHERRVDLVYATSAAVTDWHRSSASARRSGTNLPLKGTRFVMRSQRIRLRPPAVPESGA
jgi:hypothetical protein